MSAVQLAYSPYGHRHRNDSPAPTLGFNAQREEPCSGTYLLGNGYRAYSTALMRFQAPDDLSPFEDCDLNAYAYCASDPVNYPDATGHAPTAAQLQARIRLMKQKSAAPLNQNKHSARNLGKQKLSISTPAAKN